MEQGKIVEADALTIRVGATPTGLTVPPPPRLPRVFYRPTNSVKALKAVHTLHNSAGGKKR